MTKISEIVLPTIHNYTPSQPTNYEPLLDILVIINKVYISVIFFYWAYEKKSITIARLTKFFHFIIIILMVILFKLN